ncbi:hypothetical protein NZK35_00550 [Stieleria sp. ICT_E10.1]|uniref:hypothetical protein n=1 Tax=Stieleria sedimenti TaxID=2976331 RepID=UPI002180089B|nr:hypothetical protein [Stieleria sedimenti]MCS7465158.1 hypothetical protein [Stieleria sedimenti]
MPAPISGNAIELKFFSSASANALRQDSRIDHSLDRHHMLTALHQEVAGIIESLEIVDGEIKRLAAEQIDERDVNAAFADFGNVWNELNTREKSAVLTLLISRIEFDADESSLSISMHPAGIKTISAEATEQQQETNS